MHLHELAKKAAASLADSDAYLTSFMAQIVRKDDVPSWNLHYYSPLTDAMYTFDADTGEITGPNEVLKQAEFVPELDLEHVKIAYADALEKAYEQAAPETDFLRVIVLLQVIDETETWNITFMNRQFHTLNIRIDAVSGRLMAREVFELFRFDSGTDEVDGAEPKSEPDDTSDADEKEKPGDKKTDEY